MKAFELLQIIGQAQDVYVLDAEEAHREVKPKKKPKTHRSLMRNLAAVFAAIIALYLFFQTPVGAAAAEIVQEQVAKILEILFPPKEIVVIPEGNAEAVYHEAKGREPGEDTLGFSIYVDTERYTMTEENGVYYIRPFPVEIADRETIREDQANILKDMTPEEQEAAIDRRIQELKDFYASLPPCEIEIREITDKEPMLLAQETRDQMASTWESVTGIYYQHEPKSHVFTASGGTDWDSPCEVHYFVDNGSKGTFHIISRYYMESAEGRGTRFAAMVRTFTLVAPQDAAQYPEGPETLVEAMRKEVAWAQDRTDQLLQELENPELSQADMNGNAEERYTVWLDAMEKLWSALEQTMDEKTMEDLMAAQLEWSAHKASVLKAETEELGGGSLTATVYYGTGAKMLEERVYALQHILEGTGVIPQVEVAGEIYPHSVVDTVAEAFFAGDAQTIGQYYSDPHGVYQGDASAVVGNMVKGLDHIVRDMADRGRVNASVEFRPTAASDFYWYLSITLEWENGQWVVTSYGVEG